jgi:four helix bundle protein
MGNTENIIVDKSFAFAVRIVKFYKVLVERKEFVIGKQLLRSGTSVGANIREAHNGESPKDFIHKLSISQKEADESRFWLELLKETEAINNNEFYSLHNDATEILKLLKAIIGKTKKTMKSKYGKS